jgi:predicted SAM-dependent methyltransferase
MSLDELKSFLRKYPALFGMARWGLYAGRGLYGKIWGGAMRGKIWRDYCKHNTCHKLYLGCGDLLMPGWLNADAYPRRSGVYCFNATKRFPFPDASFDFVYSEHMIEHIPFAGAKVMMGEIFRVLKPGGRVRIATPDLDRLMALKTTVPTPLQRDYIDFSIATFAPEAINKNPCFVINSFVRDWGHTFIFDRETLADLMRHCGFAEVSVHEAGESAVPELTGLERHGETLPREDFNLVETMAVEGRKA